MRTREVWRDLRARMGLAPAPTLAIVSRSLDLPQALLEPVEGGGPVLVVTSRQADAGRLAAARDALGADAIVQAGEDVVDLAGAVDRLGERGLPRVLCEGGPRLMSDLVAAGRLDELCLTVSPVVVGGDAPRITVGGLPVIAVGTFEDGGRRAIDHRRDPQPRCSLLARRFR